MTSSPPFFSAQRGSISIEFALTFPLILMILLAEVAFTNFLICKLRVSSVANTVTNIEAASLTHNLDKSSIQNDLRYGTERIIYPLDPKSASTRVSGLESDGAGNWIVQWSQGYRSKEYAKGSRISLDTLSIEVKGSFIVLGEVAFRPAFTSFFGINLPDTINEQVIMFPRNYADLKCSNC